MKRGIIAYIAIVCIVFLPALFPKEGMMLFGDDIHHQYYFLREFFNQWIHKGVFPWWNPYLFSGQPFIADPMVNIWYPLTWLFVLLPLNVAYSWHIAFHVFLAMAGMRILMKRVIGEQGEIGEISAWISGVIFGLSGFFMARTWGGHVDVIAAAAWMPWVVWACTKQKNIVLASIVFALQLFSGYQTMAFMTVIIVGLVGLVTRRLVRSIIPLFFGVGLAAIQILPEQEFFRASIRTYPLPYSWVSYGSYTWKSLLQFIHPFYFGNQLTYIGPPPNFIEHSAFIGIVGLALALIGAIRKNIFLPIVLLGIWVSLGPNAPIDLQYILWKIVPMYHYLRIPPRHLILVVFGLSALAGIGFKSLKLPTSLKSLIVGAIVVEMVLFARNFIELRPIPKSDPTLVSILTSDTQPFRVLQNFGVWLPEREALEFDAVMAHGIYSATGYDTSILRGYFDYASLGNGVTQILNHDVQIPYITDAEILDRLNIKYLMVPKALDPFSGNVRYRLLRDTTYRLYENTTVKPRFYFDGKVRVVKYLPNEIILDVDSTKDQPLQSSENWYPGWRATIDGKKADITKTHNVFRTLFVPSGKHTIIYKYHPAIVSIGAIISIVTIGLLCYLRYRFVASP